MLQAFIIVLREGFETFLMVAITIAYLKKTKRVWLLGSVYWGILLSILVSAGLGYLLREGVNKSLWEGIFGVVSILLVGSFVIHMWISAPRIKAEMEGKLSVASSKTSKRAAHLGVLLFTVFMVTREGFETVILLFQVREGRFVTGVCLGIFAAAFVCYLWTRWSYLINVKRFFQVTGLYLFLFLGQVGIYSFHEFSEAGILPNSEFLHNATERFSPEGYYGKWFSVVMIGICALWLVGAWFIDRFVSSKRTAKR